MNINRLNSLADFEDARNGDSEALNRLLATWRERLKTYARFQLRQVKSRIDTSDVVQEGLIQAWESLDAFRANSEGEFRSWARKVAKGKLANARRFHLADRRTVKNEVSSKAAMFERVGESGSDGPDRFPTEDIELLREAVERLDDRLRTIIHLRYFQNETFETIAEKVGCSAGGARTMCLRALQQLRRDLKNPRQSDGGDEDVSSSNPNKPR